MFLLSLMIAAAPVAGAEPLAPGAPPLSGPAVVVLWASWCASCRAELERLPGLATAAAPLPVRTLAIDPPERARALLVQRGQPVDGAYADRRDPRSVLDAWGGRGSALPVAVALDASGRVCGRKLGLLGTDQLRAWAVRCSH
jgi:thiol-disulfide isomerase/thioredoxin